jgi:hypothetical protein
MRKPARALLYFVLPAVLGIAACSDAVTGPTPVTEPASQLIQNSEPADANLLGGLLGGIGDLLGGVVNIVFNLVSYLGSFLVPPVERSTSLAYDVTWSFYAGPNGATSSNSTVGLSITVPQGALSSYQRITVTALKGSAVAYRFQPHGLVFAKPIIMTQNLRGTSADGIMPALSAGYFASDRVEFTADGSAKVSELLNAVAIPGTSKVAFPVKHFSGYIVASGRASDLAEGEPEGR